MRISLSASRLFAVPAVALSALLAGCDDIDLFGIDDLDGTFSLIRVDGETLPFELDEDVLPDGTRCITDVIAGTLLLDEERNDDGFYDLTWLYRESCRTPGGRIDVRYPEERETGEYDSSGSTVRFYPDDPGLSNFSAHETGGDLILDLGRHDYRFRQDDDRRF